MQASQRVVLSPVAEMDERVALIIIVIIIIVGLAAGAVGVYLYIRNKDKTSSTPPTPTPPTPPTPTPPTPPTPSSGSGVWETKSTPTVIAGSSQAVVNTQYVNTRPPLLAYASFIALTGVQFEGTDIGCDYGPNEALSFYKMSDLWNVSVTVPNSGFPSCVYAPSFPGASSTVYGDLLGTSNVTQLVGKYGEVIYWTPGLIVLNSMWSTGTLGGALRMLTIEAPAVRPAQCNQNGWITIHVIDDQSNYWMTEVSAEMGLGATISFNQQVTPAKAWAIAWSEATAETIFPLQGGSTSLPNLSSTFIDAPTETSGNIFLAPDGIKTFTIPTTITAGLGLCSSS